MTWYTGAEGDGQCCGHCAGPVHGVVCRSAADQILHWGCASLLGTPRYVKEQKHYKFHPSQQKARLQHRSESLGFHANGPCQGGNGIVAEESYPADVSDHIKKAATTRRWKRRELRKGQINAGCDLPALHPKSYARRGVAHRGMQRERLRRARRSELSTHTPTTLTQTPCHQQAQSKALVEAPTSISIVLLRLLQTSLCAVLVYVLVPLCPNSLACAFAYFAVWLVATRTQGVHGPRCRLWTVMAYTLACLVGLGCDAFVLGIGIVTVCLLPSVCLWWAPKADRQKQRFTELEDFVRQKVDVLVQRHRDRPCVAPSPSDLMQL
jgi:hypothetical protein